jgi:cobalt-zinc-cadmium efflux system outer membrane protein
MRRVLSAALGLAVLAGCASVQPRRGFDEVRADVAERANSRLHWYSGGPDDAAADGAVGALLAEELTPDSAVQVALLNNRDLQAEYEGLHIAQADLVRAGLLRNPVFEGALRWPTSGSGHAVELGVAMGFLDVFWIPLRKRISEAEFEAAKLRVSGAVLDLAGEVRGAYYEAEAAEQRLEMLRGVLAAFEASHELAKRLHAAGNIRDLDLSNERAAHEEAKLELSRAETATLLARERLNELMGVWGEQTAWRTVGRLPDANEESVTRPADVEGVAVERSLELALARREIEAAARRAGVAGRGSVWGEAEIGADAEREVEGDWSVGPAVRVPIPVFDQGQAAAFGARAELARAEQRLHAEAVRVRSRARGLLAATGDAAERAGYYREMVLPLRERIVRETQLQYNAMQVSAFQLLQAKRDQVRAGGEYIDALREYWENRSRLELLLAGRMSGASPSVGGSTGAERARVGAGEH